MIKDNLISDLHNLYQNDPWINQLFDGAGLTMDNIEAAMTDLEAQYWFDTMTWGIPILENLLDFKTNVNTPIDDRRSQLQARWKSNGKADLQLLQQVANSWKNGEVGISSNNGTITVTFNGAYGIPNDMTGLQKALENVKPAHLALVYAFKYLRINQIDGVMTLNQLQTTPINEFAF